MSAKRRNAAPEATNIPQHEAESLPEQISETASDPAEEPPDERVGEPVVEDYEISSDEVASRPFARLKNLFDRIDIKAIDDIESQRARIRCPRRSAKRRSSTRARPRRNSATASPSPESVNRAAHEARCTICCHSDRDAIEEEFLHWLSPWTIGREYDVERRAIYRHAHALNLFAVRDRNLRFALGHIIDEAERAQNVQASAIVQAVRAFARVNNEGQWVEPPSHVIVSSGSRPPAPLRPPNDAIQPPALLSPTAENSAENSVLSLDTRGRTDHHSND